MIEIAREHLGALVSAGQAVLPVLVRHGDPHVAWDVSEALNAAEAALLADDRESDTLAPSAP